MNNNYTECRIESYDNNEIKELKRQILSLQAQLQIYEERAKAMRGGNLLKSEAIDYYPGEQLDFLLSVLEQAKERCPQDSRAFDIIESLLRQNNPVGRGTEIMEELKRLFKKGEPNSNADISALHALGFTYTPSRKHPKLRFHEKYMFILPSTTSDKFRASKNCLAEISKCIAVSQRI